MEPKTKQEYIEAIKVLMQEKNLSNNQLDPTKSKGKKISTLLSKGIGSEDTAKVFYELALSVPANPKKVRTKAKENPITALEAKIAMLETENKELLATIDSLQKERQSLLQTIDSLKESSQMKLATSIVDNFDKTAQNVVNSDNLANANVIASILARLDKLESQACLLPSINTAPPKIEKLVLGWKVKTKTTSTLGRKYTVFYCTKKQRIIYLGSKLPTDDVIQSKIEAYCKRHNLIDNTSDNTSDNANPNPIDNTSDNPNNLTNN